MPLLPLLAAAFVAYTRAANPTAHIDDTVAIVGKVRVKFVFS